MQGTPRQAKPWHPLLRVQVRPMPASTSGETFRDWLRRFNDSDDARRALDALADVARFGSKQPRPGQRIEVLALGALKACYFASQYKAADDPGWRYRRQMAAERKNLTSIADAAAELRALLAKNPKATRWAFPREYSLRRRDGMERQKPSTNLLLFLNQYEHNLRGRLPELHGGPWLHRFTFACLHYKEAKEGLQARMPDVAGALLFNLASLLRVWTGGTTTYQVPGSMPSDGRPCYEVAAALASATLGVQGINARTAQTRVESLQRSGAGLAGWPNDATGAMERTACGTWEMNLQRSDDADLMDWPNDADQSPDPY